MTRPIQDLFAERAKFRRALHAWYRKAARPLPWRTEPSLYRTVVSEFMLQQTQVATVLPYFERWMQAFPDFPLLARASESSVLRLWEGLGYYSRAHNLHQLAKILVTLPRPPATPEEWRQLPGIGAYTAAAICSISFEVPVACVDGNVVRILSRLTADSTEYGGSVQAARAYENRAAELMPRKDPGTHNQAMMELGATVCTRLTPNCPACPVRDFCRAADRDPRAFPRLRSRIVRREEVDRVWCLRKGALLLHRADRGARRLAGQHELPLASALGLKPASLRPAQLLLRGRRSITNHHFVESIYKIPSTAARRRVKGLIWVPVSRLESITLSGPHRRWVREILNFPGARTSRKLGS